LSLDGQSLISREVITHVEKGVLADQFYDERLYTKETLSEILKTAGFSRYHRGTVKLPTGFRAGTRTSA